MSGLPEGSRPGDSLGPSSTGLDPTVAGLLCYLLFFVTGIAFLVLERRSRFVRFHATQSTLTFVSLFVAQIVCGWIPLLGALLGAAIGLLGLVLWVWLMWKALQGEWAKLPVVGDMAEERADIP